jgi:hypothetical protein
MSPDSSSIRYGSRICSGRNGQSYYSHGALGLSSGITGTAMASVWASGNSSECRIRSIKEK